MDDDCKQHWKEVSSEHSACPVHNKTFPINESCPKYKETPTPSLLKEIVERAVQESRVLKETHTKKIVKKNKKVVIPQLTIVNLHSKGVSQRDIAREFGVSQQYISKIVRRSKGGSDRRERFHAFSLTFNAVFNYWQFPYRDVIFGRTQYKVFHTPDFHMQIFVNGRIMVRYNKDVIGKRIVENQAEAERRILEFMNEWIAGFDGVRLINYVVSSGENEFMNNPIAKGLAKKGQTIIYNDRTDGKRRSIIDFSPSVSNPSGAPNFEHVHKLHFNPDSQKWEEILDDVATGNYDPLHVTKRKIEQIFDLLDKSAQIQQESVIQSSNTESRLDKRLAWMDANFASHQRVLEKIESKIDKIPSSGSSRGVSTSPLFSTRKTRRIKKLLEDWW